MKRYIMLLAVCLAACRSNGHKGSDISSADSVKTDTAYAGKLAVPAQNAEYCFINTAGTSNQDTTKIHLVIKANKVSGEMDWLPKEKDTRKGTLAGTLHGNMIEAVWGFVQEGKADTLAVEFKLSPQQLAERPFELNSQTGRDQLDKKAGYTIIFQLDNCNKSMAK